MLRSSLFCICLLLTSGAMGAADSYVPPADKILECRLGNGRVYVKYATGNAIRRNYKSTAGSSTERTLTGKSPLFAKFAENCRVALAEMKFEALEARVSKLEEATRKATAVAEPAMKAPEAAGKATQGTAQPSESPRSSAAPSPAAAAAPKPTDSRSCIEYVSVAGGTLTYFAYGMRNTCATCVRVHGDHILDLTRIAMVWDIQAGQTRTEGFSKGAEIAAAVEITSAENCP